MTPKQFQTIIDRLELPQVAAARLFGYDPRTARKWASGESSVPPAVAILLHLLLAKYVRIEDIDVARTSADIRRPLI